MQPSIVTKDSAALEPIEPGQTRYVLADNGLFVERAGEMYTTSTRTSITRLSLEGHHEYCRLSCGKIPRVMHRAMLSFFRYAHEIHGGEAALVLLYHPERRIFRWHCPLQTVECHRSGGTWYAADTIAFEHPLELPDGYVHFGDAHSHPVGPATPSSMDVADEEDGLHLIVANVDRQPSYHIDFVMEGVRFQFQPAAIFEDPLCQPFDCAPESWLKRIYLKRRESTRNDYGYGNGSRSYDPYYGNNNGTWWKP